MSGGKLLRKLLILLCLLTLMLNGCASEKTKQTAAQENDTEEDSGEKENSDRSYSGFLCY